jgi:hypothetical protein
MFEKYIEVEGFFRIPITSNAYSINYQGEVKGSDNSIIPHTVDADGNLLVYACLWNGYQNYKVAVLVALTFKRIAVPFHHWHRIDVMFVDGNKKNCHPSNLVWKFPEGGMLHYKFSDYAYIPGFSNYAINKFGNLINATSGRVLKYFFDTGYARYKITPDVGNDTSIGRHRLICLAWLPYTVNVDSLVTNHINGIPGDDRLENLEWSTRKDNNIHAWKNGLQNIDSTVLMRNVVTGEVKEFRGYVDCADYLNLNKDTIKYRVKAKNQPVYPGFLQFKLKTDATSWREVTDQEKTIDRKLHIGVPTSVKTRNIVTGVINTYSSVADCSRATNCAVMTIHSYLKDERNHRPLKGYDFKMENDETPWPVYTENEITVYLANPVGKTTGVIVTDTKTNTEQLFTSYAKASVFLNRGNGMIMHAISNKSLIKNQYLVKRI